MKLKLSETEMGVNASRACVPCVYTKMMQSTNIHDDFPIVFHIYNINPTTGTYFVTLLRVDNNHLKVIIPYLNNCFSVFPLVFDILVIIIGKLMTVSK